MDKRPKLNNFRISRTEFQSNLVSRLSLAKKEKGLCVFYLASSLKAVTIKWTGWYTQKVGMFTKLVIFPGIKHLSQIQELKIVYFIDWFKYTSNTYIYWFIQVWTQT